MEKGDMKASHFADYRAIFRRALELVNHGSSVNDALSGAAQELYPYTHGDIEPILRELLAETRRAKRWGDFRALRDLSERAFPASENGEAESAKAPVYEDSMANLKEVFRAAYKKSSVGFQPDDALEMACKELYPYTSRKVLRSAREQLNIAVETYRTGPKGALKILAGGEGT